MKWNGADHLPALVARYESAQEAMLAKYEVDVSPRTPWALGAVNFNVK